MLTVDNVCRREEYYGIYYSHPGGWGETDLFPTLDFNNPERRDAILKSRGKTFSIEMPIQY